MLSVTIVLVLAAFVAAVASLMGRCPPAVPVLLLCVLELLRIVPR